MTRNTQIAKQLRRNQTDAERLLWFRLRDRRPGGWKFKRQVPIGRYVVDFFCADAKLIIELDGGQHSGDVQDAGRTEALEAFGYLVVRFWNHDVIRNIEGVLEEIWSMLSQCRSATPLPYGEREPS